MANYFRLYLHVLSANLLVRVRRLVADPPAPDSGNELPTEALTGSDRKRWFNRRREHDPLGEGHAETWRMRLIKVAAQIVVSSRRVLVRLSGSWPFLNHYQAVSAAVNEACARLASDTSQPSRSSRIARSNVSHTLGERGSFALPQANQPPKAPSLPKCPRSHRARRSNE